MYNVWVTYIAAAIALYQLHFNITSTTKNDMYRWASGQSSSILFFFLLSRTLSLSDAQTHRHTKHTIFYRSVELNHHHHYHHYRSHSSSTYIFQYICGLCIQCSVQTVDIKAQEKWKRLQLATHLYHSFSSQSQRRRWQRHCVGIQITMTKLGEQKKRIIAMLQYIWIKYFTCQI